MRRNLFALVIGLIISSAIFIFGVLPYNAKHNEENGRKQGEITTKVKLLDEIRRQLGSDFTTNDGYNPFFEVKADAAVIVERNGVKTLRVYENKIKKE